MDKKSNVSGLGLSGILTIIFVVLRLVGVIDWNWWWVFSPILIDIGASAILYAVLAGIIVYNRKYGFDNFNKK